MAVMSAAGYRQPDAAGKALRQDLDAIVLKALRKEPEQRYASAQELADDIRRHRARHPVLAQRQTTSYRTRRFVRRHLWGLGVAGVIVTLLGVYLVTLNVQKKRIQS